MSTAAFVAISFVHIPSPLIIIAAGIAGYLGGETGIAAFKAGGGHNARQKSLQRNSLTLLRRQLSFIKQCSRLQSLIPVDRLARRCKSYTSCGAR